MRRVILSASWLECGTEAVPVMNVQQIPVREGPSRPHTSGSVASPSHHVLSPLRRVVASAPMRVSLAGGGTDLPPFIPGVGGRVIGTAIDLRVRAVVEPFDAGWVRLELSATGLSVTRRLEDPPSQDPSARLLEETLRRTGIGDGVRLRVETELVPGTGLGGSAAAAVASIAALCASIDASLDVDAIAADAVHLERDGLGIAGGSQDQILVAHGGILDLRFDEHGLTGREDVTPGAALVEALQDGLILLDTGQRRVSGEVIDRARYPVEATLELVAAAGDLAGALREGSLEGALLAMQRTAAAKIARDPGASADAVALAARLGPLGARVVRMCGAGGGGHVLVWAPASAHAAIVEELGGATVRRPAIAAAGVRLE